MNMHKLPEKDSREILTSTAWNALIHHPVGVEEEEEREDLPSTVDMDAIKGAPSTPLAAPPTPWSLADHGPGKDDGEDESSSDEDDDDDSDGTTKSSSGSESDESGSESCSWSTSSSSSSSSEESTPSRQTFSVSKSDIEGSLRLKISATKIGSDNGRAAVDSDSSSKLERANSSFTAKKSAPKPDAKPITAAENPKTEAKEVKKPVTKASPCLPNPKVKQDTRVVPAKDPKQASKKVKPKESPVVKKLESPVKKEVRPVVSSPPKKKLTEASRLRTVRKKRVTAASASSSSVAASSSLRHGRAAVCQSSRSSSTTPDSSESEEGDGSHEVAAQITQLAQQLGHIGPSAAAGTATEPAEPTEALPSMTEHLQVINQEDLAAILPDVVTTETTAVFDGFEDVSSESGKGEKKDVAGAGANAGADSGSDVELPDQIVSDAIKRIHVDSEDVDNSDCEKDAVKTTPPKSMRNLADSASGSDDEAACSPMYSSSLLQQFVEKTEILSAQCERLINAGRVKKHTASVSSTSRVKKSKSVRSSRTTAETSAATMPELESYRLDCSLSNVSPDSGIQSVPGSPVHDALAADPTPPVLRPVTPPENAFKKRRGRPKKSDIAKEAPKLEVPARLETSQPSNTSTACKRGPGRPKKSPPVLEINALVSSKSSSGGTKLNLVLNEICERVNRRLDSPTNETGGIELKDLQRIINDHKSTKARNSKIDAIFSKSKKLSNIPNIAIVKPMQHNILNERNEDDEKQNKKGDKKGKDKPEDGFLNKLEGKVAGSADELAKLGRDKKKHEKEKKLLSKTALTNHNRSGRSVRARSRNLSSGTDVSCDKSVESDATAVRPDVRVFKTDRFTKETKKGVSLIEEIGAGASVSKSVPIINVQPLEKKSAHKKKPKLLSVHRSLNRHKKKKKKQKKKEKHGSEKSLYIADLEKIINALQRISIEENKKLLPTAPVAPTPASTSTSPAPAKQSVPGESRGKRTGKKRKASDKSKAAEKEMAFEKVKVSDRESSVDDYNKEKEKPKRKQKKGQDAAKDASETSSPNEQRLPLKKRHYHLTPSQPLAEVNSNGATEPANVPSERLSGKDSPVVRKEVDRTRDRESTKKDSAKEGKGESQPRVLRSSVEDTIEATINRFSTGSPTVTVEAGQRTVIVTPKKRHRVEEDDEAESPEKSAKEKDKPSATSAKSASGKISQSRPLGNLVTDKGGGKPGLTALGREGVIKSVGVIEPKRRSSNSNKEVSTDKLSAETKADKPKRALGRTESKTKSAQREKRQTRSAVKPADTAEKLEPLVVEVSSDTLLVGKQDIKKETANSDVKTESKAVKQPAAGIFEPSTEEVEIDSSILVPLNSPSEMKSDLKGSLSAKKIKLSQSPKTDSSVRKKVEVNATPVSSKPPENNIAVKATAEVVASIPTLTTAQFILRTAEMKKKARRRKFINRTGFPTARKRKKKLKGMVEGKTVDRPVIIPAIVKDTEAVKIVSESVTDDVVKNVTPDVVKPEKLSVDVDMDDDIPLNKIIIDKPPKISHRIEEKLNAGRKALKRALKRKEGPNVKKMKLERELRPAKPDSEPVAVEAPLVALPEVETKPVSSTEPSTQPQPAPIRKRKRSSTIKNTKSKMKSRYQLPLLSMKKFKKAKTDEKVPSEDESEVAETKKKSQPRWRKKYLTAGLLSDHFKDEVSETSAKLIEKPLNKWTYIPEEHPFGLLPPPAYCEHMLRRKREQYRLPYDLWWQHANNQLVGRDVVPSWNYRKIRTNIYFDVKPQTTGRNEAQSCSCKPPSNSKEAGCGDDCINRMVLSECSPSLCPCGDKCSNQGIQKHEYAPGLEKYMTKDKGWGVRSSKTIKAGEFILEYVGEVVSEKEFKERMQSRYVHDTHHYCLHLDGGLVIDGHRMGGDGRFVNHSCEPNCEMQKWTVNGLFRMALFALRDIPANQELSYDYNFSLYDPSEGQVCLCHSKQCRGVIGGKSQRVTTPGGAIQTSRTAHRDRDKKTGRGRKSRAKRRNDKGKTQVETTAVKASLKPMSHQQRCFAQTHRCFLLRNVEKVRRGRDLDKPGPSETPDGRGSNGNSDVKPADVFYTQLNALSTLRSIKTRRLAQAEDNPELAKAAKLAHVFKHLYSAIVTAKDEKDELLAGPFMTLPTKKKQPQYYTRITDPIDLTMVDHNINSGKYGTIEAFDSDVNRLLGNKVKFYGRTSELGIAATRLKRTYNIAKLDVVQQLEEILGDSLPASFLPEKTDPGAEEEDVIRCICGLYKDEGVMIQCERCLVWQHCDCVKEDDSCEHYLCERCEPREVNYEILMEPVPEYAQEGQTHYISLMRGSLQLRLGDAVYVLRDMLEESVTGTSPPRKVTYKTAKNVDYADLDIFRIERLWIDEKGAKFAFGHHYLRPHETYHEPSRKFFLNEVMRVPLYEVVPLDLILQHCWVLDLGTFCRGRPIGAPEEHIYICEYRVDKSARLFSKIVKHHPICTKNYAFEKFETKLRPVRTYTPHGSVPSRRRVRGNTREDPPRPDSDEELPLARVRDHAHAAKRDMQKKRLNRILTRLLGRRQPKQQPLDVTYLLVKRAARSKTTTKKTN